MNVPAQLQYTEHDEWIARDGGVVTVGITDHAQDALGDLVHIELPEVGKRVAKGDVVCEVESVKAVAEIYSPADGEVVEVNEALADEAQRINADPYGCWIYKLRVDGGLDGLLDAAAYSAKIA